MSGQSPFSDPAPASGYTLYSARSVIDKALRGINKQTSEVLSDQLAFQEIDNFQMEVLTEMKRWSFMQKLGTSIGHIATGQWKIAAPTDINNDETNQSTWNFRIGTTPPLTWIDKAKWDQITFQIAHTTLAAAILVSDTTITLADSGDFPEDGGVVSIGENTYTYTANDKTTGILTLNSASTTANALGADIFFGAQFGTPEYWTIWGGYLYFYPILGAQYDGFNAYLDYWIKQTMIRKDSDLLIIPDVTAAVYYLQWKFLRALSNGKETVESQAAQNLYVAGKAKMMRKENIGRTVNLKPLKNSLNISSSNPDSRRDRLQGFGNGT